MYGPLACVSSISLTECAAGTSLSNALNKTCVQDLAASTKQTITFAMCGNGIVEEDEDCDPGQGATSSCCDSATCKFRDNAVCDPASSPCCTSQCAFSPASTVCRPVMDEKCDMPEMCTGKTAECPADQTKPNGASLNLARVHH